MIKKIANTLLTIAVLAFFASCNCADGKKENSSETSSADQSMGTHDGNHEGAVQPTSATGNFGEIITVDNAFDASELPVLLEGKETINVKLAGNIEAVCQMSGCWMDVDMGDGETVHVTFKDDGFVLPKDAAGKYTVIEGIATYEEIPVKLLKHLAEDDGKTQEEIDAITEPKMEYTVVAKGVFISEESL